MTCEACRTLPPVVSEGYTAEGKCETIGDLKTYVTGSTNATIGIVDVYDIMGMTLQTLQGADILARRLNALVLVPDFFQGRPALPEWIPPNTEEKKKAIGKFLTERAALPENVQLLKTAVRESSSRYPSVTKWGALGLCWGGRVCALVSGPDTPFIVTGQVHPGHLEKADAEKITIPHIVLVSKDEPADTVATYAEAIRSNKLDSHVETYSKMWHGWMGARARLDQDEGRAGYVRGYTQIAEFFEKYLGLD